MYNNVVESTEPVGRSEKGEPVMNIANDSELYDRLAEKQLKRTEIFDGVVLHVVKDDVELPNGRKSTREVALHNGAVAIVALAENGDVVMERQFRYPFDEVILEIPAGKIEKNETDPQKAAERELREETGITADSMRFIGYYYSSPAILSERIGLYLATGLHEGEREPDADEFLETERIPLKKLVEMVIDGQIPDGKTQAALLKVYCMLKLKAETSGTDLPSTL